MTFIEFKARFGGKPREIMVPVARVIAIYARENGQGMAFPSSRRHSDCHGSWGKAGLAAVASIAEEPQGAPEDRVVQLVPSDSMLDEGGGDAPRPPPASGNAVLPSNASNSILRVSNTLNLQDKMQPSPI
jgi:stringent starvation protein B